MHSGRQIVRQAVVWQRLSFLLARRTPTATPPGFSARTAFPQASDTLALATEFAKLAVARCGNRQVRSRRVASSASPCRRQPTSLSNSFTEDADFSRLVAHRLGTSPRPAAQCSPERRLPTRVYLLPAPPPDATMPNRLFGHQRCPDTGNSRTESPDPRRQHARASGYFSRGRLMSSPPVPRRFDIQEVSRLRRSERKSTVSDQGAGAIVIWPEPDLRFPSDSLRILRSPGKRRRRRRRQGKRTAFLQFDDIRFGVMGPREATA